ncbi:MAG: hypothetical protein QXU99_05865 [Candidatus Bathyarchaeia archaeon]
MSATPEETGRFNAENATAITADFLKRLGYKRNLRAMKVTLSGETYIVEMGVEKKTAKVQIDTKTKEIKEYEIQEGENAPSVSKAKIPMVIIPVIAILILALKLLNVF